MKWISRIAVCLLSVTAAMAQERPGGGGGIRPTNSPPSPGAVIEAVTTSNPIITRWVNPTNLQASATNAQPPSTILTNLSATGAFTNANPFQFASPFTPFLTITNGARLTNVDDYVTLEVFGDTFISTNLWVSNRLNVAGNSTVASLFSTSHTNTGLFTNQGNLGVAGNVTVGGVVSVTGGDVNVSNGDINITSGSIQVSGTIINSALTAAINARMNGQTNANQFGPSTVLTIKTGPFITNAALYGFTTNKNNVYTEGFTTTVGLSSSGQATFNSDAVFTGFGSGAAYFNSDVLLPLTSVDSAELSYLNGVTSPIQTQLGNKIANLNGRGTNLFVHNFITIGDAFASNNFTAVRLGFGETVYGNWVWAANGGVAYLYDNSSGRSPISFSDADGLTTVEDGLNVALGIISLDFLTVHGPGTFNDSLKIPRASDPATDEIGKIAFRQDGLGVSRGVLQIFDGTDKTFAVAITNTPSDGQSPVYNATTKTWSAQTPAAGGSGVTQTNGNQFGASSVLSIKSGALLTNLSARGLLLPAITADRALMVNGSGDVTNANTVTQAELEFLGNVTSDIQTQFSGKMNGQTNSSQFGASTVLTLRDGVTVTNANLSGTTSLTNPPGATAALRIWQTNGLGYTEFTVPSQWMPTNRLVFWQTNATAGKLLKVNSVSIASGVATINITNDFAAGTEVTFSDPDSKFAATDVTSALAELNDSNGSGPNASDGKVNWTQLVSVPAGFADGNDAGSTNNPVQAVGFLILTNGMNRSWVHLGNSTNVALNWSVTNCFISSPSNTFTVSFANPPSAGSPAQSLFLELRNTNSTSAFFPTNGFNGTPVIMLAAPSTNTYVFNFDGTNFWTESGQILTTGMGDTNVFNVQPALHSPLLIGTNTVTGNFAYPTARLFGAGTGGTNYVLFADLADRYMNAESNVSIKAVYNTSPGLAMKWSVTITNISGANTGIDFSAVTNRWRFFNHAYGTNAPSVITNNTALFMDGRSDGTNTQLRYNYFAAPL